MENKEIGGFKTCKFNVEFERLSATSDNRILKRVVKEKGLPCAVANVLPPREPTKLVLPDYVIKNLARFTGDKKCDKKVTPLTVVGEVRTADDWRDYSKNNEFIAEHKHIIKSLAAQVDFLEHYPTFGATVVTTSTTKVAGNPVDQLKRVLYDVVYNRVDEDSDEPFDADVSPLVLALPDCDDANYCDIDLSTSVKFNEDAFVMRGKKVVLTYYPSGSHVSAGTFNFQVSGELDMGAQGVRVWDEAHNPVDYMYEAYGMSNFVSGKIDYQLRKRFPSLLVETVTRDSCDVNRIWALPNGKYLGVKDPSFPAVVNVWEKVQRHMAMKYIANSYFLALYEKQDVDCLFRSEGNSDHLVSFYCNYFHDLLIAFPNVLQRGVSFIGAKWSSKCLPAKAANVLVSGVNVPDVFNLFLNGVVAHENSSEFKVKMSNISAMCLKCYGPFLPVDGPLKIHMYGTLFVRLPHGVVDVCSVCGDTGIPPVAFSGIVCDVKEVSEIAKGSESVKSELQTQQLAATSVKGDILIGAISQQVSRDKVVKEKRKKFNVNSLIQGVGDDDKGLKNFIKCATEVNSIVPVWAYSGVGNCSGWTLDGKKPKKIKPLLFRATGGSSRPKYSEALYVLQEMVGVLPGLGIGVVYRPRDPDFDVRLTYTGDNMSPGAPVLVLAMAQTQSLRAAIREFAYHSKKILSKFSISVCAGAILKIE